MLAIPQIKRRLGRQIQQLGVFLTPLDATMRPGQRRLEVVPDMLVELLVLLIGDVVLRPGPDGTGLVHRLIFIGLTLLAFFLIPFGLFHHDGHGDMVGVLAQHVPQAIVGQEIILALAQVQCDLGTA